MEVTGRNSNLLEDFPERTIPTRASKERKYGLVARDFLFPPGAKAELAWKHRALWPDGWKQSCSMPNGAVWMTNFHQVPPCGSERLHMKMHCVFNGKLSLALRGRPYYGDLSSR